MKQLRKKDTQEIFSWNESMAMRDDMEEVITPEPVLTEANVVNRFELVDPEEGKVGSYDITGNTRKAKNRISG